MFAGEHVRITPLLAEAWHRAQPGQIVGPRHARPEAGAARGCGPAASGEFDRAYARCRRDGRSGRRNRCFDRTKEHGPDSIEACRVGHSFDTVTCPIGGETENASHTSHTEILTLPFTDFPGTGRQMVYALAGQVAQAYGIGDHHQYHGDAAIGGKQTNAGPT
jgi:hypothetical protein